MTLKPAVAFVSQRSGTGKTTLLTGVLKCLKRRGYRVGTIKHSMHPVQVDLEGKDSHRHSEAGSDVTVLAGPGITVTIRKAFAEPFFDEILEEASRGTDIVLVEGFKDIPLPKIEVCRSDFCQGRLFGERGEKGGEIIAVASDVSLPVDIPVLPLNDPEAVCDLIEERFLKREKSEKT